MDGSWKYTGWTLFLVAVFLFGSISADRFRMIEGDVPNSGPIEINTTDDFEPLCDNFITEDMAVMICKQIGLPSLTVSLNNLNLTNMTNMAANETCDWNMRNVPDCLMSAVNISDCNDTLGISCGGEIRIPSITHYRWTYEYAHGMVEVHHGGKWNRVCADDADFRVAKVMCGEMDDSFGLNAQGFLYDPEPGPFVSVTCLGNETMQTDCRIESVTNCMKGFGLRCNGTHLRLSSTEEFPGQLNISMKKFVPYSFKQEIVDEEIKEELGNAMASVICSQNGFSRYPAHLVSSLIALNVFLCTGLEDMLEQCTTRGQVVESILPFIQIGDVAVECTVLSTSTMVTTPTAVAARVPITSTSAFESKDTFQCYQGDCLTTECGDEAPRLTRPTSATCTLGKKTKCFVSGTTQCAGDASSTLNFGCTLNCNAPGLVTLTGTEVNYCCNSNMCNLEPDTLMEVVGAIAASGSAPCRFTTLSTVISMIVLLTILCYY